MSAHDAAATFARGLAIGMFWCAVAIVAVLFVTALIFWAQDVRARRSLPRERPGAARSVSPPPVAGSVWEADPVTPPEETPTGVHLIEWRAARRERERAL